MKKVFRIRKNDEFRNVILCQNVLKCGNILIFYKNNNFGYIRVGVTVTSKIKKAVVRNKIKRQIRAIIDMVIDFNKKKNLDIVFLVKINLINFNDSLNNLKKELKKIL